MPVTAMFRPVPLDIFLGEHDTRLRTITSNETMRSWVQEIALRAVDRGGMTARTL